jgi:HK97 family phage major capsid protein
MNPIAQARTAYNDAVTRMTAAADAIEALPEDATAEQLEARDTEFTEAQAQVERCRANLDRLTAVAEARAAHPHEAEPETPEEPAEPADPAASARAAGTSTVEAVYRPDRGESFFSDLYRTWRNQDPNAAERLHRNTVHALDTLQQRDVTSADPGAAGFIPPIYLADEWAELPRAGRPFANRVPSFPFPPSGLTITVPKVQTGVTEAVMTAENTTVSETDIDTQTVTASMVTIAGQNDISRQALERSYPGMDMVIYRDLAGAYDVALDTQLISGTGANGQHLGIRAVSSPNTVAYTDGTPTAAELLPKLYDAIQKVASNRYRQANLIVMHPRRAAWLASNLSSTFPLFQQGGLYQGLGTQDQGFAGMIGGVPVLMDPNIGVTYGAGTNEDEIYVLFVDDVLFAEGPIRQTMFEEIGSGNLLVRLQLFAYSFFVPHRQVKSITIISGTGLVTPAF